MTIEAERLYHDAPANGDTDVYTATTKTIVQLLLATNTTPGVLPVSVRIDPAGGAAAEDLLTALSIPANDAIRVPGPFVLEAGDKIVARNHTAALGVTLYIGGFTIT